MLQAKTAATKNASTVTVLRMPDFCPSVFMKCTIRPGLNALQALSQRYGTAPAKAQSTPILQDYPKPLQSLICSPELI